MSLYQIIIDLLLKPGRATVELSRGLWLVHYPSTGDNPARLVAGRYLNQPSERELILVRNTLLEVLDDVESRVAYDLTHWRETDNGDWHGFVTTWRATAVTDAFSHDPDHSAPIRRAIERREERIAQRRKKSKRSQTAKRGPKPML